MKVAINKNNRSRSQEQEGNIEVGEGKDIKCVAIYNIPGPKENIYHWAEDQPQ